MIWKNTLPVLRCIIVPKVGKICIQSVEKRSKYVNALALASSNSNICIVEHQRKCWHSTADANLTELPPMTLSAAADKGFNYLSIDKAYIAQKKNHFQHTCQI